MQPAANVTSGAGMDWHAIAWKRVYRTVKNVRQQLFRASRQGDLTRVRALQRLRLKRHGGTDDLANLRLVHHTCHRQIHSISAPLGVR
jgi:N-terminal domain of reverse transcriptase/HNH endonuclease